MGMNDYMEFAEWLANIDGEGATDEEFAEFFVYMYKMNKSRDLSASDMRNAPIDEITKWINECLHEIIESEEECQSAWWKQKGE